MCQLLEKLLLEEKIIDPNKREVIVVVNDNSTGYSGNVKDADALNKHLADLEADNKRSIILTVNRFLTGVTMPLVDSMIFMKDT
jgi:deoxyxylulose-5-phosphate synthase